MGVCIVGLTHSLHIMNGALRRGHKSFVNSCNLLAATNTPYENRTYA